MSYTSTHDLGEKQSEWLNLLDFFEKDLVILDKRLMEVAGKNTGTEASGGVEHFQNQFFIQRKNIADLKHRIQNNRRQAADDIMKHGNHVHQSVMNELEAIGQQTGILEKTMKTLRQEFNVYLSKWM